MNNGLVAQLDAVVAERNLLTHPFYKSWTAGTLSRDALCYYAAQYYRYVASFPRFVSGVHASTDDDDTRRDLLDNLIEEEHGERNHPELWLRFCDALGVSREAARSAPPMPENASLLDTYGRLTRHGSTSEGLAALYVYESQVPAVAAAKIDGLARFYGISSHDAISFFLVHVELDRWHSRTCAKLLERSTTLAGDSPAALQAGEQASAALWSFLDGVQREAC
jgi:pyrroloquinoline-quinone synthase